MIVRNRPFGPNTRSCVLCVIRKPRVSETDPVQTCVMRPAAIRQLGVTGKMPVLPGGMDAIQKMKTMAGSPDADQTSISVPQSCAWFLCF
jgi:hypothetical protein